MKRLTLSNTNQKIFGVCGGIGEYIDIDPTIIRIIFILLFIFYGIGLLPYLLLAFIIPKY